MSWYAKEWVLEYGPYLVPTDSCRSGNFSGATAVYAFIGNENQFSSPNVTLFAIVTHRVLTIYFTVCTRIRVSEQKYLLDTKFTDSKARSRLLNL